jgi:type IV fimbrial biogenesis protein FimT
MYARTLIRTQIRLAKSAKGFSVIEMMFAVALTGVLFGIAIPMFKQPIQNYRIKTQAESVLNGLKLARSTAVQRNENIRFELIRPSNTSSLEWNVKAERDGTLIQSSSISDDTHTVAFSTLPSHATVLTFNGLGTVVAPEKASSIQAINVDTGPSIVAAADRRDLSIRIFPGGMIRMCDPNVTNPNTVSFCA